MKTRDLIKPLQESDKGWLAINEQNEVVESELSFAEICKKVEKSRKKLIIVPAAESYSGVLA